MRLGFLLLALATTAAHAQTNGTTLSSVLPQPLSRAGAIEMALRHNASILKGKADLEAAHGVVVQLRSIAYPVLSVGGGYNAEEKSLVENFPLPAPFSSYIQFPNQNWNADVHVQESVYQGGRMTSAFRSAKLTRQQALLNYNALVAGTLLSVRVAYDDVLVAKQQIVVNEASVQLLTKEWEDAKRRYQAGTRPQLDVLRAHVELANEQPRLIEAKNNFRIGKNNLLNLLGCDLPQDTWEDVPLELSDTLQAVSLDIELPSALAVALKKRPELDALRKTLDLRREDVVTANAGFKPTAQVFGGYNWQSLPYERDLDADLHGWTAGASVSWNLFDSGFTRGKVIQARANYEKARLDLADTRRTIELEVRTAHSDFLKARETLESQKTVQEEAQEALRQAQVRLTAGTSTQLDVLNAQTDLTQARTTQAQALHDYSVARARLQRAMGEDMEIVSK